MNKKKNWDDPHNAREAAKYVTPIPSREWIMEYLAGQEKPLSRRQLLKAMQLDADYEKEALRRRLLAMTRDGQ